MYAVIIICICYLTQISMDNTFYEYDRFDVYTMEFILLVFEMMLLIRTRFKDVYHLKIILHKILIIHCILRF